MSSFSFSYSYSFSYPFSFFLWLLLAYLSGALPWSVWLSKCFFSTDPRSQPDHNPGAANAFRVGGWPLGLAVLLLDFAKAFLPVAAARWLLGFPPGQLLWLAIMPTLGHAFSLFLRFHGGRGIVTMFGVWAGLTLYQAPLIMGLTAIVATLLIKNDEARSLYPARPHRLPHPGLLPHLDDPTGSRTVRYSRGQNRRLRHPAADAQTDRNSLMPRHLSALSRLSRARLSARTFSSLRTLVTGLSHLTALALLAALSLRLLANLRFLRATRRFPAQSPSLLPRVSVLDVGISFERRLQHQRQRALRVTYSPPTCIDVRPDVRLCVDEPDKRRTLPRGSSREDLR